MSNLVRYDSLLVRHLVRELNDTLRGRAVIALRLDADERRASLEFEDGALLLELHPARGWIIEAAAAPAPDIRRLHRSMRIGRVHAPPDERILRIDFAGTTSPTRPIRSVVVELMTNQHNLLALDDGDRIVAALRPRSAGRRELRGGRIYQLPPPAEREGAAAPIDPDRWEALAAQDRLIAQVAYLSPLNLPAMASWSEYERIVWGAPRPAAVRRADGGMQPYPQPIGADAVPMTSLLEAMRHAAGAVAGEATAAEMDPERLDRVRREITRLGARMERMEAQRARALPEAVALRARADLLLARLHEVPRGAARVELTDFAGSPVVIDLDPALPPADNARRMYDGARKREHAAERVPALIAEVRDRIAAFEALLDRAERGSSDAAEIDAALPPTSAVDASGQESPLPYRRYTTTGGLEVRVGRSGRANDDLTFRHSNPDDVWLHARDVAGAHVILRWPHADAGPPARDLAEAAVLAALHSRSRTSGTVPVDWTRRKYVRKPRKAPPGTVLPDRVKTVFVSPDEETEKRMRNW